MKNWRFRYRYERLWWDCEVSSWQHGSMSNSKPVTCTYFTVLPLSLHFNLQSSTLFNLSPIRSVSQLGPNQNGKQSESGFLEVRRRPRRCLLSIFECWDEVNRSTTASNLQLFSWLCDSSLSLMKWLWPHRNVDGSESNWSRSKSKTSTSTMILDLCYREHAQVQLGFEIKAHGLCPKPRTLRKGDGLSNISWGSL